MSKNTDRKNEQQIKSAVNFIGLKVDIYFTALIIDFSQFIYFQNRYILPWYK